METLLIVIVAAIALLIVAGALVAFAMQSDKKRREMREGFGPEYHRTLARTGDRSAAEKELAERQKRVESFDLKPLSREDASQFSSRWQEAQARFVDIRKAQSETPTPSSRKS